MSNNSYFASYTRTCVHQKILQKHYKTMGVGGYLINLAVLLRYIKTYHFIIYLPRCRLPYFLQCRALFTRELFKFVSYAKKWRGAIINMLFSQTEIVYASSKHILSKALPSGVILPPTSAVLHNLDGDQLFEWNCKNDSTALLSTV